MLTASVVPMERVALASQPVAGTVCFSKNAFCGGDGTVQEFIWKNAALLCDGELQEPPSAASAAAAIPAMAQRGGAVAQRGEADFPSARQEVVAAVAAEEEAMMRSMTAASPTVARASRLFETYLVVGAPTRLHEPLQELLASTRWTTMGTLRDNLRKLSTEQAQPELLCMYPPAEDEGRAQILAKFCFPDHNSFDMQMVQQLPSTPRLERTVFLMTEGTDSLTPLYGCCLYTQEVLAANSDDSIHVVAPRCYCVLSRLPAINAHFALLESVLWHERLTRKTNTVIQSAVPPTLPPPEHTAYAPDGYALREKAKRQGVWSLYFNHGTEGCHFSVDLPSDCQPNAAVRLRLPSAWRDRRKEGPSDMSDESDVVCMSILLAQTKIPVATDIAFEPEQLHVDWPRLMADTHIPIYKEPYGGASVELAEWAIATAFERLDAETFVKLMLAVMLERQVVVLSSPGLRAAIVLAVLSVLRPWRYQHALLPILYEGLYDIVCAPTPFVIGLPSKASIQGHIQAGATAVRPPASS